MEKSLNFKFKKETKRMIVYENIPSEKEESFIPAFYIKKAFFINGHPQELSMIIKTEETVKSEETN